MLVLAHKQSNSALPIGKRDEGALLQGATILVLVEVVLLPELEEAPHVGKERVSIPNQALQHLSESLLPSGQHQYDLQNLLQKVLSGFKISMQRFLKSFKSGFSFYKSEVNVWENEPAIQHLCNFDASFT